MVSHLQDARMRQKEKKQQCANRKKTAEETKFIKGHIYKTSASKAQGSFWKRVGEMIKSGGSRRLL